MTDGRFFVGNFKIIFSSLIAASYLVSRRWKGYDSLQQRIFVEFQSECFSGHRSGIGPSSGPGWEMRAMGIQGTIEEIYSLLAIMKTMEHGDPEVHVHGI